ncbi:MAG: NAAT family transporter [Betaproteobacteria bacterium]|nr:NAAT family transporter [Betaproteobacteria bacterium]
MMLLPVWAEQIKYLVGIFAILNPLGAIPIYLSLIADRRPEEMHRTALKTSVAVAVILILAVWAGDSLLVFFGIGIPAFRIAGGLLVLIIAIAMFDARTSTARHTDAEQAEAESKNDIAVVPLAIPLLAGPGAISLTIVDAHQAGSLPGKFVFCLGIAAVAVIVWLVLRLAEPIGQRLGTGGLNIATRVMGLILAAMAVQFMADGLLDLFPGLSH